MKDQKTCKVCNRTRPLAFFAPQGPRYRKPYCRSCYNAYQSVRGKIDRAENRSITMEEFRTVWLPLLVDAGEAPWLDETIQTDVEELHPYEQLTEEEGLARQEVIYQEMLRTLPSSSDGQPTS